MEEGGYLLHVAGRWDLFSRGTDFAWPGLPHSRATPQQKELPEERASPASGAARGPFVYLPPQGQQDTADKPPPPPGPWNKVWGHRGPGPQTGASGEGNLYLPPLKTLSALAGVAQWIECRLACKPKGLGLDPQSGHMPGLQARSPVGDVRGTTNQCISHVLMFVSSFSLPPLLSKNK
ncbi:hypothetical protein HJG60_009884 [Phyllostomus discolor]|uniref:Uncharacterized protein n=1 Tax=Phyllostomus discolor TaxID=89673 RepID=A0A834EQ26_9CHIR|nr:hypothetical protein HJG60_009884 [Phyllostomus discolor]